MRALNAQIRLLAQPSDEASAEKTQVDFVCECPHESCFAVVPMTLAEWGAATSEGDYYVAHPEHAIRKTKPSWPATATRSRAPTGEESEPISKQGQGSSSGPDRTPKSKGGNMALLLAVIILLVLFGVIGGLAITKFLFFVLIIAALLALIGAFTRTA